MPRSVAILGIAESGLGAALLAKKQGYKVFASDIGRVKESYRNILYNSNIDWEEGTHSINKIIQCNEVIKSPGIPDDAPVILEAKERGLPVISEVEFAFRYSKSKIIAITGSNGKTTTANLVFSILKKAGCNVDIAGNIGFSYAKLVAEKEPDYIVLEISSFQLDGIVKFKPDIAILLNVTSDHLDRYNNDMQLYIASKFKIVSNQTEADSFIYFKDDKLIEKQLSQYTLSSVKYPFAISKKIKNGASLIGDEIIISLTKNVLKMSVLDLALQGKHNACNTMASAIAAQILGIKNDVIRESLVDFKNIEHRLEPVLKVHGVQYINDSKATNINATWYALECSKKPIVWICGGVDKGNDYSELMPLVKERVKAIICLGKDNAKIINQFKDMFPEIEDAKSMEDAVNIAYRFADKNDVVLLSPACASFDLFKNFEERGRKFKEAVRRL